MAKYIIKRVLLAVVTLWLIATITFILMNMVPGGPFLAEKAPSEATLKALNEKYGLDKPLIVQYGNYMSSFERRHGSVDQAERAYRESDHIQRIQGVRAGRRDIRPCCCSYRWDTLGSIAAMNREQVDRDNVIIVVSTCCVLQY